ncbi:MAG: flagellar hook assembly protein FlgD [Rhodospirillales bacterium]|nr:MAG: flagellar hook assembly protein FlgD [Rhodospirillales bacterium]
MLFTGISNAAAPAQGTQSAAKQEQLQDDLNRFLTLLITQLQHQDPLDPMDANEFTAQLVQFASVEQQIYQNANLEKLLKVQENSQVAAMVNYLGTWAEVTGKHLVLEDGAAEATYTLNANAADTTIAVKDAFGRVVFVTAGETTAGRHTFTWSGRDGNGNRLPDGNYTVEVASRNREGRLLEVAQTGFGRITGAAADGGRVSLLLGDAPVPMEEILSVKEGPATAGG